MGLLDGKTAIVTGAARGIGTHNSCTTFFIIWRNVILLHE